MEKHGLPSVHQYPLRTAGLHFLTTQYNTPWANLVPSFWAGRSALQAGWPIAAELSKVNTAVANCEEIIKGGVKDCPTEGVKGCPTAWAAYGGLPIDLPHTKPSRCHARVVLQGRLISFNNYRGAAILPRFTGSKGHQEEESGTSSFVNVSHTC